jgi:hypothetical protein
LYTLLLLSVDAHSVDVSHYGLTCAHEAICQWSKAWTCLRDDWTEARIIATTKEKEGEGNMKYSSVFILALILAVTNGFFLCARASVFLNEIHYDNDGADQNEGIEIAGLAGEDLAGWSILLYNGNDGRSYSTIDLSGAIPDQQNGFGTLFFPASGIQNGPDGMALVDNTNWVAQFLSYEGAFWATDGPASGLLSADIGVAEGSGTTATQSLQLVGNGSQYEDFSWTADPIANTQGAINTGQAFVPIPSAFWLLGSGLMGISVLRNRRA